MGALEGGIGYSSDMLGSDSEFGLAIDMKRALLLELLFS